MDCEKMTSGEIAGKAGISQKALRLYDEKGLLKPVGYSEGNYRLYDQNSLVILEKIIALKHIGFSLDEIRENLEWDTDGDISHILQNQADMMDAKIRKLQKAKRCIQAVLARTEGKPDWDDVAGIIRKMEADQRADERHLYAVKHQADGKDWYEKIFDSLDIRENERILDLGCGYGNLWRNNWERIPKNVLVDGYDLHESHAERFAEYLKDRSGMLPDGTLIRIFWEDVENSEMWEELAPFKGYHKVIAHYLLNVIDDAKKLVKRVSGVLVPGGMLSLNYYGLNAEYDYWEDIFADIGLKSGFVKEQRDQNQKKQKAMREILERYFTKLEYVRLPAPISYENPEMWFERAVRMYPKGSKILMEQKKRFLILFNELSKENGSVIVDADTGFWHCFR